LLAAAEALTVSAPTAGCGRNFRASTARLMPMAITKKLLTHRANLEDDLSSCVLAVFALMFEYLIVLLRIVP